MAARTDIEAFLRDFKIKLDFWGLIFRVDRGKNFETLLQLEYSIENVKKELRELSVQHCSEGPMIETLNQVPICGCLEKQFNQRRSTSKYRRVRKTIRFSAFLFISQSGR